MEARKDYLLRDRIPQAPKTAETQEARKDTHIILFNDEDCSQKFANGQVQEVRNALAIILRNAELLFRGERTITRNQKTSLENRYYHFKPERERK